LNALSKWTKSKNRIKEARKLKKISGIKLADKIGITSQYLYDIENGKTGLRSVILKKIADELGVSVGYLLYETDNPTPLKKKGTIVDDIEELSLEDRQNLTFLLKRLKKHKSVIRDLLFALDEIEKNEK